jgi:hypothetical protein
MDLPIMQRYATDFSEPVTNIFNFLSPNDYYCYIWHYNFLTSQIELRARSNTNQNEKYKIIMSDVRYIKCSRWWHGANFCCGFGEIEWYIRLNGFDNAYITDNLKKYVNSITYEIRATQGVFKILASNVLLYSNNDY